MDYNTKLHVRLTVAVLGWSAAEWAECRAGAAETVSCHCIWWTSLQVFHCFIANCNIHRVL